MVKKVYKLIWPAVVLSDLKNIYDEIYERTESHFLAHKIRKEIYQRTLQLKDNPYLFQPDRFKSSNNGDFRAFEHHTYLVTYKVDGPFILIVRIRYAGKNPIVY